MTTNVEVLELSPEELQAARERIRWLAYDKWTEAGCPNDSNLSFWLIAEQMWIEHEYVPHREDLDPRSCVAPRVPK